MGSGWEGKQPPPAWSLIPEQQSIESIVVVKTQQADEKSSEGVRHSMDRKNPWATGEGQTLP